MTEMVEQSRYLIRLGKPWARPAALWGAAFSLVGLYLTDWKVVLGNVPFIKAKYEWETPR